MQPIVLTIPSNRTKCYNNIKFCCVGFEAFGPKLCASAIIEGLSAVLLLCLIQIILMQLVRFGIFFYQDLCAY